jgi:hypothetical protein
MVISGSVAAQTGLNCVKIDKLRRRRMHNLKYTEVSFLLFRI